MNLISKGLYTALILFIIIIETTGIDSDESLPHENHSDVRGRMVKSYSGVKPEPITCTGEGFVKDPQNCAVFYRCMKSGNNKYTIFRFQCGPGTVYDPDHEVCNYARWTRRAECGGILPPFAHTTDINDIQDNIYNEIPSPMVSSKPVNPSYTLQKTSTVNVKQTPPSYAVNSTTELYITSPPASSYPWASSINPINTDRNIHKTTTKPLETETKISHSIYRDNICKSDGFIGDGENCRKFYRCVANQRGGFTRYEFMCSETTVWDEDNQICNHVWAVKKSKCSIYNEKVTGSNMQVTTETWHTPDKNTMNLHIKENPNNNGINTIQHQLQISYGTKVTQSQIQIGNGLVHQNQTQINYGDRLNQTKKEGSKQNQTQISHGSAVSQSQIQVDYGDKGVQTQLQIDHSKDASQNQIQISETSTKKGSTTIWESSKQEQNKPESTDCTEDGFIGDSIDCRKFYRCVNNGQGGFKKFEFNCADGTAWDPSIKSCNHIWAVQECNLHGSVESSPHTVKTTTYRTTQSYHTTISTERTTAQLIEDNENSDSVGYENSEPDSIQTPSSSTTIMTVHDFNGTECLSHGFMGDNNDCKIFYRCVENGNGGFTKHTFKCGDGTLWDPEIKACNHASAIVKCGGNIAPDINKVEKTTEKIKTSTPIYIQNATSTHLPTISFDEHEFYDENNVPGYGSSNNEIQTTTTRNQHTTEYIPIDAKCTQSGFVGSSSDCKRFYRCVDDGNGSYIRYEFMCGEGTLWDQELKSCNYAWAVTNCGSNGESLPVSNEINHKNPHNENVDSQTSSTTTPFPASADTTKHETDSELCISNGFFGDTKHCEKFYRCVDDGKGSFIRYEYVCGEGTLWDQNLKSCNHRWAVQCNLTKNTTTNVPSEGTTEYTIILTTSFKYEDSPVTQNISEVLWSKNDSNIICTKEGFITDPKNCKSFYRCVNDGKGGLTKYQFNCGEGTYWNQEILSCDHITSDKICEPEYSSTTKLPHTQEEILSPPPSPPSKPMETSATCTSEGFYGDQHDCRKYYQCVNNGKGDFTMYNFSCEEGTSWNKDFQVCTYESLGRCTDLTSLETTQNPFQQENSATTSEKLNTSSTSMAQCEIEGHFAVPNDCKKFIWCARNDQGVFTKNEYTCPDGTVWIQEMLNCDFDTENYCNPQMMTESVTNEHHQQTTEKYVPSSSGHLPGDKLNNENESTINPPPNSTEVCLSEGYYANKNDCRKFHECVSDGKGAYTKHDYMCFKGTAWDPNTQLCNYFNRVSSCQESVMDNEDNTQITESSRSTTQGLTSSTTSTTTSSSPDSNLHSMDVCESEGYFGDTQDCKKFYRCVQNDKGGYTKYDFTCAEGTIWDKDISTCNHPERVANPSCNKTTTNSNSMLNTTDSTGDQSEASKTPENNSVHCSKAGFYPDPNNCKKFYRCVDWDGNETKFSIFHFECGEGTIWDPALDTCNHEDSVYPPRNCSGFQSPATEETTTTEKESTTKSQESTEGTTQSTGKPTTQPTTETATTESVAQTTTERVIESTTEQSGETTTDRSGEASTEQQPKSTTERLGESTTEYTGQSTTEQSGETTTEQLGEKTTKESVESTTERLGESTTETIGESTTEKVGESTTEKIGESTTDKIGESTTEKIGESTTEKLDESTTEKVGENTTEKIGENTTEESLETTGTTEQLSESTTKESIETTITEGLGTVQTTTEQVETTESGTDNSTQKPTGSDCPQTENDQNLFVCPSSFRRHPRYCNLFYQCDENEDSHELKIAVFTCPNNTIYDESKTKCVNESKAEKSCSGEISEKRRVKRKERIGNIIYDPLVASEKSYGCTKTGYFAFEKDGDCSQGFLKCTSTKSNKLRGLVYQCPERYVFWNVSKRCEPLYKISDCKRSLLNDWSRRSNIPIEIQNVAW